MTQQIYDFVVVGAGSNNLTAAAYLAAGGHSVCVLERKDYWGGGCVTREVTLPGFKHDLHATNVFLVKANPLIRCDELGLLSRFGLKYVETDDPYHGSVFDDGSGIATYTDLERTCAEITKLNAADSKAYRGFAQQAAKYVDLLSWGMFSPPSNPATFLEILNQSDEGRYLLGYMRASAWQVISETFKSQHLQTHLYKMCAEMMVTPEKPGTAFALVLILGFAHRFTSGFVQGGSQKFSDALVACIEYHGGKVLTNQDVVKLRVSNGKATAAETAAGEIFEAREAIIAGISPWRLEKFIDNFDPKLTAAAEKALPSDFGVFLSSYALDEPVVPRFAETYQRMQINQCCHTDVSKVRKMFSAVSDGDMPSDYFANFICASIHDPSRAPAGKATLYLYHMVPMIPRGKTSAAWNELREPFADWLLKGANAYIGNLEGNVLGAHHESPWDMEECSPSFRNGDVMGLGTFADQFLGGRPTSEFAQYRVPGIERLYLCGPFMHPGGGVTGGGRAVAMRVMHDLKMDLDRAFTTY
jgi:phytoene dehydrogenase-like protein